MKKQYVVLLAVVVAAAIASCRKAETPSAPGAKMAVQATALPPNSWKVPVDVTSNPSQTDYLNFGWQTFVAISWPALSPSSGGQDGQPDTNATIGAKASNGAFVPAVWATYRDLSTIMLNNGADPGASYTQAVTIPSGCSALSSGNPVAPGFQPMFVDASTFTTTAIVKDYINQATNNPLVDQKGWYTFTNIRINQSEYDYIHQNAYYVGANQVAAYNKNGQLQPFPKTGTESGYPPLPPYAQYGALEIKAAWRVLDPSADAAIIPRYYTQWGYFLQPDGTTCQGPTLFGLIALHILRLTPSMGATWYWASFEQVDNTEPPSGVPATLAASGTPNGSCTTPPYNVGPAQVKGNIPWNNTNTPDNICQVTNIPSDVQSANKTWQGNLNGTVWQYYQMVNTLNPCPSGVSGCVDFPPIYNTSNLVNTGVFANTAVESYYQTHSCLDCHGYGTGDGAPQPLTGTNQIFTFVLQNAYYQQPPSATAQMQTNLRNIFRKPPFSKAAATPKK